MKRFMMLGAVVVSFGVCSQGFGYDLLDRMLGAKKGCGCAPVATCCEPAPACCEVAPVCTPPAPKCCEPAPVCCAPAPKCEPVCETACAPACEPACDACESACDPCAKKKKTLFASLKGLFHHHKKSCGCEPVCDSCAPACEPAPVCCEPAPVCEPVCDACAPACDPCAKKKKTLLDGLHKLFSHKKKSCGCEPACDSCNTGCTTCGTEVYAPASAPAAAPTPAGDMPPAPAKGSDPTAMRHYQGRVIMNVSRSN